MCTTPLNISLWKKNVGVTNWPGEYLALLVVTWKLRPEEANVMTRPSSRNSRPWTILASTLAMIHQVLISMVRVGHTSVLVN
jgi:hypothetical protein